MSEPTPITREETYLSTIAAGSGTVPTPITREELFLAKAAGADVETPTPITRKEMFLDAIQGGESSAVLVNKSITANGTYDPADDSADGYSGVTVNVSGATLQEKTAMPTPSQQTITPDSGYDGLSRVTIDAISPTKAAQTYTPGTSNQIISSGRWLTGNQTILGDANLVEANIANGVTIFGITGTHSGGSGDWTTVASIPGTLST